MGLIIAVNYKQHRAPTETFQTLCVECDKCVPVHTDQTCCTLMARHQAWQEMHELQIWCLKSEGVELLVLITNEGRPLLLALYVILLTSDKI